MPIGGAVTPAVVRSSSGALVPAASPAAGDPAPGQPPLTALYPVQVLIGGASVTPAFAGLYQVNVRIPEAPPAGIHALSVVVNGIGSAPVSLFVGSAGGTAN